MSASDWQDVPPLQYGDQQDIAPWRLALAQSLLANPIPYTNASPATAFLSGFLGRGGDVFARRTMNQYANSPQNPTNRLALARINQQRQEADAKRREQAVRDASEAAKRLAEHKKALADEKRQAEKDQLERDRRTPGTQAYKDALRWETDLAAARGSSRQESGGLNAGDLSPRGLDMVARAYLQTGNLPPLGMGAAGLRKSIIERAAAIDPNADIGGAQATFGADKGALSQIQKNIDAVEAFKRTALANADLMVSISEGIPDTGVPLLNSFVRRASAKAGGNVEVQKFNTALAVVQPEFARILSNPNLSGQLTDAARHEMQAVIDGSFTRGQLRGALKVLKQDAENRDREYRAQAEAIKRRIGGRRTPDAQPKPSWKLNPATGKLERVR